MFRNTENVCIWDIEIDIKLCRTDLNFDICVNKFMNYNLNYVVLHV